MFQPDTARLAQGMRSVDSNLPIEYCQGNLGDSRRLAIFCNTMALMLVKDYALMVYPESSEHTEVDTSLLMWLPKSFTHNHVKQLVEGLHQDSLELSVTPTTIRVASLRSH